MLPCQEDLSASLGEQFWFDAEAHEDELLAFMSAWQGPRDLCCLDVFGFTGAMSKYWKDHGFSSEQYDIQLHPRSDDVLSKRGFLHLMRRLIYLILQFHGTRCLQYGSIHVELRFGFTPC